jgi:hypothetical protein
MTRWRKLALPTAFRTNPDPLPSELEAEDLRNYKRRFENPMQVATRGYIDEVI